ncbi:MAG: nucleotidyltransferase family protein [Methylococcaceae bacterium]|nr:nucleotidyltransferase family protein [Methylococcaceae bacterium]
MNCASNPPYESNGIVGVLLAAGEGRRFGGDKLVHPLAGGLPMAVAAARALRQGCGGRVLTVLRPEQERLAELLAVEGVAVGFDADVRLGMGHSLAAAVRATPNAAGWLVALADMPYIQFATIARVADTLRSGATLAAPFYRGERGHPVGFSSIWRDALSGLQGDQGARDLLVEHGHSMIRVDCEDEGVLVDVDRPGGLGFRRLG